MSDAPDATEVAIRTEGLTKVFGDVRAVDDLALSVRRGEIYAFLGRNGAGKTTTIRMMLALARPTAGSVHVFGHRMEPNATEALMRVGSMVEEAGSYGNLTVRENLDLQRRLLGLGADGWVDDAVEMCGLGSYVDRRANTLSLGNKQRLGLARALLHKPDLLILDEPTNGLDPIGIADTRNLLRYLASERSTTVFLSSHILSEVQQLADRIGIIHEGRLLEEIGYDELKQKGRSYLELVVNDTALAQHVLESVLGILDHAVREQTVRVYSGFERADELNRALVQAGVGVTAMRLSEENLEEHFVKLTGETAADERAQEASPSRRWWAR